MSNQYIFVDSTYRDRILYPSPADFVIPFSLSIPSQLTVRNANNVLCSNYPTGNFSWNNFYDGSNTYATFISGGTPDMPVIDLSSNALNYVLGFTNPDLSIPLTGRSTILNGFLLEYPAGSGITYTIVGYMPIYCQLELDAPLDNFDLADPSCNIILPTQNDASLNFLLQGVTEIFQPNSTAGVLDLNIRKYRTFSKVQAFNAGPKRYLLGQLESTFPTTWTCTDFYLLMEEPPLLYTNVLTPVAGAYFHNDGIVDITVQNPGGGYVRGTVYEVCTEWNVFDSTHHALVQVTLVDTNGGVRSLEILTPGDSYTRGQRYFLCDPASPVPAPSLAAVVLVGETGQVWWTDIASAGGWDGTIFAPFLFSPSFIQNTTDGTLSFAPYQTFPTRFSSYADQFSYQDQGITWIRRAFLYEGSTAIVVSPPFPPSMTARFTAPNVSNPRWSAFIPYFFLYTMSSDGVRSLRYTGSMVSVTQTTCYEMELVNLILPNLYLDTVINASLTSAFPYVYVEFYNASASTATFTNLYSNNPYAARALFVCPISDVTAPLISRFLNIQSLGKQSVKFRPTDNLRFRVLLPDGEVFTTLLKDTTPPSPPDSHVQIQAMIRFTATSDLSTTRARTN